MAKRIILNEQQFRRFLKKSLNENQNSDKSETKEKKHE